MPVVSLLNQKGGVGKTTLSIHLATALAAASRVLLIDADPQHSALDWAAQREEAATFDVIGMPKPILHRQVGTIGSGYDWVIIDGPPRVNELARSAIAASDLVVIPVQPSPYDVWAAKDIVDIVRECEISRPNVISRFLINRLVPNTTLAGEVSEALAEFEVPLLDTRIRNRTEFAKSARLGLTALETEPSGQAAAEIRKFSEEIQTLLENKDGKR
jgi:chromosome partitioning protein